MLNRDQALHAGFIVTCIFVAGSIAYSLGTKKGREEVHFNEVVCVDHPLKYNLVLCSKYPETETITLETPQ